MNRFARAAVALVGFAAIGCQGGAGFRQAMRDLPGGIVGSAAAHAKDQERMASATPQQEFGLDRAPGETAESWETARRQYPGALPPY